MIIYKQQLIVLTVPVLSSSLRPIITSCETYFIKCMKLQRFSDHTSPSNLSVDSCSIDLLCPSVYYHDLLAGGEISSVRGGVTDY